MLRHVEIFACITALLLPSMGIAQSALQETRDDRQTLIVKDVGDDHWVVTYDRLSGTVSGIVLDRASSVSQFVDCTPAGQTIDQLTFGCFGATACIELPCSGSDWSFISQVTLPRTFFLPRDEPLPSVVPPICADVSGIWNLSYFGDCHNHAIFDVPISQRNCEVTSTQSAIVGEVAGASVRFSFTRDLSRPNEQPCILTATGSAVVVGRSLAGTYRGQTNGVCCTDQLVVGTISAIKVGE